MTGDSKTPAQAELGRGTLELLTGSHMAEGAGDFGAAQRPGENYAGERQQDDREKEQRPYCRPELGEAGACQQRLPHSFE